MKRLFGLLLIALISTVSMTASETNLLEIADVLKEVESNNNPAAIGDGGKAFGVLQIHEACIEDVNEFYGTTYTHEDAHDPDIAEDIFIKYIQLGIKLYKERCGEYPTANDIVRMWNGGIYRGYEYESTKPYLAKYLKQRDIILSNQILVSDMPKYLTKKEAVSKFKLEFLPTVTAEHGNDEVEIRKAWDYYKGALYKSAMITTGGLDWSFPKSEIS